MFFLTVDGDLSLALSLRLSAFFRDLFEGVLKQLFEIEGDVLIYFILFGDSSATLLSPAHKTDLGEKGRIFSTLLP